MTILDHDIKDNHFTLNCYLEEFNLDPSFVTFCKKNGADVNYICFLQAELNGIHYLVVSKKGRIGYNVILIKEGNHRFIDFFHVDENKRIKILHDKSKVMISQMLYSDIDINNYVKDRVFGLLTVNE